jgi:hypothetical protein
MAWHLEGTYAENCNCDVVCPCIVSGLTAPATQERCHTVLAFHVERGEIDGVDVAGKHVIVVIDAPRVMGEGNWRVGMVMDAAASPEQSEKLGAVFGGQLGGPMAGLGPLIGEVVGIETAPIEFVDDGMRHRARAGDLVAIEIEDIVVPNNPSGEPLRISGLSHPVNSTLTIAKAIETRIEAFGLSYTNVGTNGHSAPFSWSS